MNSPDILALCETNLDDSIDSGNFSARDYLALIRKDSSSHMHGFPDYVNEGLNYSGLTILVELINLVNSVIIFLFQMTILRWLTFLDLFISSDASICSTMAFPPLRDSDDVVVSVYTDFPSNSQWDAPFHHITYGYSRADWDSFQTHFKDVP